MSKFKFKRVKRCDICASKLDEKGGCTWDECPKNLAKKLVEQEKQNQDKNQDGTEVKKSGKTPSDKEKA